MENNLYPTAANAKAQTQSLIARLAAKFGVEAGRLLNCLTKQVLKQPDGAVPTNEELMVLLLVCENYGLNPFNREIYAFRGKGGDIVPVVSLDGWAKIVRSQKDFNGMSFRFAPTTVRVPGYGAELPEYVECAIRLKGVDEPVCIQEYMVECFNERSPVWKKWPRRMLRTRSFIQCARLAFSLTGLYDEGEDFAENFGEVVSNAAHDGADAHESLPSPQQASQVTQRATPKLTLEREKLDTMLTRLTTFAQSQPGGWERAHAWVTEKLAGDDRAYALEKLRAAQSATAPAEVDQEQTKEEVDALD